MSSAAPKIKLYTNHGCPWAHRAHIALAELGLPFEEEIIDLSVPRTKEYLAINPRGLVPSLSYDGEIITESAIVSQFLADAHPSHLVPAPGSKDAALRRARINFFVDTYFSKANSSLYKLQLAKSEAEANEVAAGFIDVIAKEVEPLLKDAKPYFGGSDKVTLAEVLTGSFTLRLFSFANYELIPKSILTSLEDKAPSFYKWAQTVNSTPSVNGIYDEKNVVERTKHRIAAMKAAQA
ncbi:glutathione S-transferase domain-containing protein [Colletotrichum paranaense]|uniref:Glutathione S-transferase domain-containing protein n=2 Tax=Colletotrichum acutatum species complex TaxID=2707335 RepID=A0A9Q8SRK4_9PEZI|nr:glutathione S-transferase domain-containing protein [Colletotrichum lupini]XP_060348721.1 glutathione S-transferase domain-containing protein [Colletotrichum paranaense]KAK1537969.1 glutathione S-transferase domain-containing protein [Colletotrichum paranaense]KAK1718319.1 glutathione S-transferase domain-containing protein [Colletotrichum lupini]UQC82125.1 glutathione S-transferase domain-containing protein [Colletotrichum lupini]